MKSIKKNKYKSIIIPLLIITTAILIVGILVIGNRIGLNYNNGFTRKFFSEKPTLLNQISLPIKIRSICKGPNKNIYFETDTAGFVLKTDPTLNELHFIHLRLWNIDSVNSLFTSYVDSPFMYLFAGNIPAVVKVNMNSNAISYRHFPKRTFTRTAFIGDNSYAFRAFKRISGKWEQQFIKGNISTDSITEEKNISQRTGDGGFSTDGLLHYDTLSHLLVYINYYRNHFVCMDTNLNLIYTSSTLDTLNSLQITAGITSTGNYENISNTSPTKDVNLQSCVSTGKIFINSALKADNETRNNFNDNSVIDLYNIVNGMYEGSFYIPLYKKERLMEIKVSHNRMIVLYPSYAVIYKLPFIR